jgi:sigma-E factor negative regulatory protein RseC
VPTEEGVIIRIDAAATWVKTVRSGACKECSSKGMCHTLGGGQEAEVSVVNPIGARVGDRVAIKMATSPFLKATFLIYMFPILVLVAGAAAGEFIARAWAVDAPWPSALLGFGAFAAGLFTMRRIALRLVKKKDYRPTIVKVLGHSRTLDPSDPSFG